MSSNKSQGFCHFKNFGCNTYKCCGFCKNEKCEWRCKDSVAGCNFFSTLDPQREREDKIASRMSALAVLEKAKATPREIRVKIEYSSTSKRMEIESDMKKEARRLRRLKRKNRNRTV